MTDATDIRHRCSKCGEEKYVNQFYRNACRSSGLDKYCKPCRLEATRASRARRAASTSEPELSNSEELPDAAAPDDLYILCYDGLDVEALKIGRAADVEARARQLETGHNFRMRVLATFSGLGQLESCVHRTLSHSRASNGRGREWFAVSLDTALHAVALALRSEE